MKINSAIKLKRFILNHDVGYEFKPIDISLSFGISEQHAAKLMYKCHDAGLLMRSKRGVYQISDNDPYKVWGTNLEGTKPFDDRQKELLARKENQRHIKNIINLGHEELLPLLQKV